MAISQEPFDALLAWLGPDRDAAGRKYEIIRNGLIRIFVSKGFNDAEDLADLTINRVIDKLPTVRDNYVGDPARYFHGFARNIVHEARRRKEIATDRIPECLTPVSEMTDRHDCLQACLKSLSDEKRELILGYYLYVGRDKVTYHKHMSMELGITKGALRTRAHHIRVTLETCVVKCTQDLIEKQNKSRKALLKEVSNVEQQ